jgi:hypothetical protein
MVFPRSLPEPVISITFGYWMGIIAEISVSMLSAADEFYAGHKQSPGKKIFQDPDIELTTINAPDKQAASFTVAHRMRIRIGDRIIPPPIPIVPEIKPITAPVKIAVGMLSGRILYTPDLKVSSIRDIAISNTTPSKTLYMPK